MPTAPLHPCPGSPTCPHRVLRGLCPEHQRRYQQQHGERRTNKDVRKWYFTTRWRRLRLLVISEQYYRCIACGHAQLQLDVDHIQPHRGDAGLFWKRSNLQAMCHTCHAQKTGSGA